MGIPSKQNGTVVVNHAASFFLGALLPTVLLFFLASDRVGEHLSSIANHGAQLIRHAQGANLSSDGSAPTAEKTQERFPGLAELLPRVATDDRNVLITSVNGAWARPGSLLDLFRQGFQNGEGIAHLLNHTLIVAVDPGAFHDCKAVHPHCYLLQVTSSTNLSSANRFMSKGYLELVWLKLSLQQRVLELGYNYLFTDVDIVWFRDPFRHINLYADVTISADGFNGDPYSMSNSPNTGVYYVKSTNRTVEMLKYWQAARTRFPPDHHDQTIFNEIKYELVEKFRIRFEFLDTALFGGFCQYREQVDRVCTMHANCCIGLENKVHDLKNVIADWKNYTSLPPKEKKSGKFRWTFPAQCKASLRRH